MNDSTTVPQRIGLIGLDTSHVTHFTRLLNDASDPHYVTGGEVVAAYPGGSRDFEKSWSRVEGFTRELRDDYGVEMLESPEAVAERADLVFIESVDGRGHLDQFERVLPYGRPIFIDKPMTVCSREAERIKSMSESAGVAVMSSSALRFAENLTAALQVDREEDGITGCDVYGPTIEEPTQPGLFWYGIHSVEILMTVMGCGWQAVSTTTNKETDLVVIEWDDGRIGTIRGSRREHFQFGATIHRESGPQHVGLSTNAKPYYASLLEAIMRSLPHGQTLVPLEETVEIIRLIEAANRSRSGKRVETVLFDGM